MRSQVYLRRFLFQTVLGSGTDAGLPPLAEKRGRESRLPLPVFAMRRGRFAATADPVSRTPGVPGAAGLLSPAFEAGVSDPLLDARNVLLTDTALNVAGRLTVEDVLACPLSGLGLDGSAFDASVSDPPLTLTSVEGPCSSTLVMCLFSISSAVGLPFTVESFGSAFSMAVSLPVT